MGKFKPLADYCNQQALREFELPFHKIETLIATPLAPSANRPQYWANVGDGHWPGAFGHARNALRDVPGRRVEAGSLRAQGVTH